METSSSFEGYYTAITENYKALEKYSVLAYESDRLQLQRKLTIIMVNDYLRIPWSRVLGAHQ